MKTKADWRKEFHAIRSHIPTIYRQEAAQAAAQILTQLPCFTTSQHIACYLAVNAEFDCKQVIEAIWQAKKNCYVPRLTQTNLLEFARYQYADSLHLNRYAILEPVEPVEKIGPEKLDMVIVPLLAFDLVGQRLGTGGGYYDRTFAFLSTPSNKRPQMLGMAYAAQAVEKLPADAWDIQLDGVIT
jgi:5-formyltetrahydrofolate cyclo-ligase